MNSSITNFKIPLFSPRGYVVGAIALAVGWLSLIVAANVLIDPEGVFNTGLIVKHANANGRFEVLHNYQAAPDSYDAVLFASSRGGAFDRGLLAELMGARGVANFSVAFGLLSDHLPALEYLLRDKQARGERLKAVFLVLDADFFGKTPWTNLNIDSFLPPEESGESRFRFWWRYLTAFQFRNWREDLRNNFKAHAEAHGVPSSSAGLTAINVEIHEPPSARILTVSVGICELTGPEFRSDVARQLALLRRFVVLCEQNKVRLVVAFSPLNRANVRDDQVVETERVVADVARITPVWDFDRPGWLSAKPDLWYDFSHYSPVVGTMMLRRIFGGATSAPADFGQLKGN